MTVVALAIEPNCPNGELPVTVARRLGLRLLDFRRFERDMAWYSDANQNFKRTQSLISSTGARSRRWQMTNPQLGARYAEMVLRSAADGDALIVGWMAPVLLSVVGHVLRVKLVAPAEHRANVLMQQLGYRNIETARLELASTDSVLARFVVRSTGEFWSDERHYDLVLNNARAPKQLCVRAIACLAAAPQYRATAAEADALEVECLKYAEEQRGDSAAEGKEFDGERSLEQPSAR